MEVTEKTNILVAKVIKEGQVYYKLYFPFPWGSRSVSTLNLVELKEYSDYGINYTFNSDNGMIYKNKGKEHRHLALSLIEDGRVIKSYPTIVDIHKTGQYVTILHPVTDRLDMITIEEYFKLRSHVQINNEMIRNHRLKQGIRQLWIRDYLYGIKPDEIKGIDILTYENINRQEGESKDNRAEEANKDNRAEEANNESNINNESSVNNEEKQNQAIQLESAKADNIEQSNNIELGAKDNFTEAVQIKSNSGLDDSGSNLGHISGIANDLDDGQSCLSDNNIISRSELESLLNEGEESNKAFSNKSHSDEFNNTANTNSIQSSDILDIESYRRLIWDMYPGDRITLSYDTFELMPHVLTRILDSDTSGQSVIAVCKIFKENRINYTWALIEADNKKRICIIQVIGQSDIPAKYMAYSIEQFYDKYNEWLHETRFIKRK